MNNNICQCNTYQPKGEYICCNCGTHIDHDNNGILLACPNCGNDTFIPNNNQYYLLIKLSKKDIKPIVYKFKIINNKKYILIFN